jgi:GTP-binding protein EngB required for normal cell division
MKTNEFAKINKLVNTIIKRYRKVRKECGIAEDGWRSRSIECLAKPFLKGYFTLAVVGKVSSGKSTFINALLGCKDLLPTGHDQTTCGVTYIEYGDSPEVTITFGDGHKVVIKDDISGKIKPHVAIPEKYHHLPVNNIDDMILGGFDFNKIWEARKQLEDETLCTSIDKKLLKDYIDHREKKDIAVEVHMKYPFNEELKGWRVIDTPGIGAIGGIETRTRQLLATQKEDGSREVDAIIFLQDGSQTLDQTDSKKFVKEQLDNFTETDKDRLFYVLTHSGTMGFLDHKEKKIDFIKRNYGEKIKCLTFADSLLYTFLNDLEGSDVDLKFFDDFERPTDWAVDEWNTVMGILFQAKQHLKATGDTFNHDTMLRILQEWAHFDELKADINHFVKTEKEKTLLRLFGLIASDYLGFRNQLARDKELVDGDLAKINAEIKAVEEKRKGYNVLAQKADHLIKIDRINSEFEFINKELKTIDNMNSIAAIRTSLTNLFDSVQEKEKDFFEVIINTFSDFFRDFDPDDLNLESIDFSAIEKKATIKSREPYEISPQQEIEHCCRANEIIKAKYGTRINPEKKLNHFKTLALMCARSKRDKFLPQVKEKVEKMRTRVFDELNAKTKEELARLENLKSQLSRKEEFKAENDRFISDSYDASKELIKLVQDYGYEF